MASRKTWVWILVGGFGGCLVALVVVAGAGVYFVTHHIRTARSTNAEAVRGFDAVIASFHNQRPLYEVDSTDQPRAVRPLDTLPTSRVTPTNLWMLAWDPDKQRLSRVALPFWMLRLGKRKWQVVSEDQGFDLDELHLDAEELERIGPALICDYSDREGTRVLVWTE